MSKWLLIALAVIAGYVICMTGIGKKIGLPG